MAQGKPKNREEHAEAGSAAPGNALRESPARAGQEKAANAAGRPAGRTRKGKLTRRVFIALGIVAGITASGAGTIAATYRETDGSINGPGAFDPPEAPADGSGEALPVPCTVVYASKHAGNTLKIVRALKNRYPDLATVDALATPASAIDLSGAQVVVLASGVYFGAFADEILDVAKQRVHAGEEVFILYTSGAVSEKFAKQTREAVEANGAQVVGAYNCTGAYRLLSIMPVMHEGHPTPGEITAGVEAVSTALGQAAEPASL